MDGNNAALTFALPLQKTVVLKGKKDEAKGLEIRNLIIYKIMEILDVNHGDPRFKIFESLEATARKSL